MKVGTLKLLIALFRPVFEMTAQAVGIACGMMADYTGSTLHAFRKKRSEEAF